MLQCCRERTLVQPRPHGSDLQFELLELLAHTRVHDLVTQGHQPTGREGGREGKDGWCWIHSIQMVHETSSQETLCIYV